MSRTTSRRTTGAVIEALVDQRDFRRMGLEQFVVGVPGIPAKKEPADFAGFLRPVLALSITAKYYISPSLPPVGLVSVVCGGPRTMFRNLAATLFLIGATANSLAAPSQKLPVSWEVPKSWELVGSRDQNGATMYLYAIHDTKVGEHTNIPLNGLITIYEVPKGKEAWNPDRLIAARMDPLAAMQIVSGEDNEHWKSYLYSADRRGEQTLVLYRLGMIDGVGAEVMLLFPFVLVDDTESFALLTLEPSTIKSRQVAGIYLRPSSATELVEQFNAVCATLKISGVNSCVSKAKLIGPSPDVEFYVDPGSKGK